MSTTHHEPRNPETQEARRGQDGSPGARESMALRHLDFRHPDPLNCERIKFCCLDPPGVRYFAMATPGKQGRPPVMHVSESSGAGCSGWHLGPLSAGSWFAVWAPSPGRPSPCSEQMAASRSRLTSILSHLSGKSDFLFPTVLAKVLERSLLTPGHRPATRERHCSVFMFWSPALPQGWGLGAGGREQLQRGEGPRRKCRRRERGVRQGRHTPQGSCVSDLQLL